MRQDEVDNIVLTIINTHICYRLIGQIARDEPLTKLNIYHNFATLLKRALPSQPTTQEEALDNPDIICTNLYKHYEEEFVTNHPVTMKLRNVIATQQLMANASKCYNLDLNKLKNEINDHLGNADKHFNNLTTKLGCIKIMNKPRVNIDYIFGKDVKTMTEDDFLNAMRKIKKQIDELKSVNVASKRIDNDIQKLTLDLSWIVKAYDALDSSENIEAVG